MNVLLFDDRDLENSSSPNRLVLRDQRAVHTHTILKAQPGAEIRVGKIEGLMGRATVVESNATELTLEIGELTQESPTPSRVELILALPRPKSLKRTLRAIANLGIKRVHLINSFRVDKSYWTAPALQPETLRATLLEGLSIARDTRMPEVKLHKLFKPFAQDVAPHLHSGHAFVAHPVSQGIVRTTQDISKSAPQAHVAVGPEGGFTEYEVGLLNEAGFESFSLGDRIYSVENAVPVLTALFR